MKVIKKNTLIDLFQYLAILALGVVAIFFMKEVINQFASNHTGLKQSEVNITEYPIVTICLKGNINFEYGSNFSIFLGNFNLTLADAEFEDYEMEYDYLEDTILTYSLQKIYSYFNPSHACYRITQSGYKVITSAPSFLSIVFHDKSTNNDHLPDIEVYFTSLKNSDGIIFSEWMSGDELKFSFSRVRSNLLIV